MWRVPGEGVTPPPPRALGPLGREALLPVTRGESCERPTFTERSSKNAWGLAGVDRKGPSRNSHSLRKGCRYESTRRDPSSHSELHREGQVLGILQQVQ